MKQQQPKQTNGKTAKHPNNKYEVVKHYEYKVVRERKNK